MLGLRRFIPWIDHERDVSVREILLKPKGKLSLRTAPRGGQLAKNVKETDHGTIPFGSTSSASLLIHGFAVNEEGATKSYQAFCGMLDDAQLKDTYWVYWPGDMYPDFRSKASYHPVIERAQATAETLAEFIAGRLAKSSIQEPFKLRIFAHSMGCRVALETLKQLLPITGASAPGRRLEIEHVSLMAAAVRRVHLQKDIHPDDSLREVIIEAQTAQIYRSYWDFVLAAVFRLGQAFSTTKTKPPRSLLSAVGRWGIHGKKRPVGTRKTGPTATKDTITELGHTQYWSDPFLIESHKNNMRGVERIMKPNSVSMRRVNGRTMTPVNGPAIRDF